MNSALAQAKTGMFDRVAELFGVIDMLPADMSDQEVAGLLDFLPPDAAKSLGAMLIPRAREGSMAFMRMMAVRRRTPGMRARKRYWCLSAFRRS
jgi:hypothetical protein